MEPGIDVVPFGVRSLPDAGGHQHVDLVALRSSTLAVGILTLGAALHTVEAPDRQGRGDHVVLHLTTLDEIEDRKRNPYLGATCGRWAGRVAGAQLDIDGTRTLLDANEGPNLLHGGPDGFDRRIWEVEEARVAGDGARVVLALTSPDGDQGFPGRLEATATYELVGHVLRITYHATTDAPTAVGLTNHAYWNLGGPLGWTLEGAIGDHELRVGGTRHLPVDAAALPVGDLVPSAGTPFDLGRGWVLADLPAGIDHAYEVPPVEPDPHGGAGLARAAELHHPASGRTLTVATDQPALQVYTANGLDVPFARQAAVCLEAQRFPDAPHQPGLGPWLLRPGEHYRSETELTFGVR